MGLKNSFANITAERLIEYLLKETGQKKERAVDTKIILEFLKLQHFVIDLSNIPPAELALPEQDKFRALLYYPEKIVAVEQNLKREESRFSIFHEIAHYVLPNHQNKFFLCLESDMSEISGRRWEWEANRFAADIMFHGNLFVEMANNMLISAVTIKTLKDKFKASIEATTRHLIEKTIKPVLLVIYEKKSLKTGKGNSEMVQGWNVKYCISSPSFSKIYGVELSNDPENKFVEKLGVQFQDITDSIKTEDTFKLTDGRKVLFESEYFTNTYNVFRIMIPKRIV